MPNGERPHHVVALALPGVVLLDLAAPAHLFGHCGAPHYSFEVAGLKTGPTRSSTGLDIVAQRGLSALSRADTVVVPGCSRPAAAPTTALGAVWRAHLRGARVMAIGAGAFILAQAGLLDGRRATTHRASVKELAGRYPKVKVEPEEHYVDEGSILTSAGVAAGLDLCLHVIGRDHGADLAAGLARRTGVAPRHGEQAQFVDRHGHQGTGLNGSLEPTRRWALAQLQESLDIASLARRASLSPRTFTRRFRQETGTSPGQWVLEQRTQAAQALLETTDLPIEHVARRCGFGSAATLRTQFGRRLSTTPTRYRRDFRPS